MLNYVWKLFCKVSMMIWCGWIGLEMDSIEDVRDWICLENHKPLCHYLYGLMLLEDWRTHFQAEDHMPRAEGLMLHVWRKSILPGHTPLCPISGRVYCAYTTSYKNPFLGFFHTFSSLSLHYTLTNWPRADSWRFGVKIGENNPFWFVQTLL